MYPVQDLNDREADIANKESKLAANQAEVSSRESALDALKTKLDGHRKALEEQQDALQAAQAEASISMCTWTSRCLGWARCAQVDSKLGCSGHSKKLIAQPDVTQMHQGAVILPLSTSACVPLAPTLPTMQILRHMQERVLLLAILYVLLLLRSLPG